LPELVHSIVHSVFKYLSLNTEKQIYIEALCDISVYFICGVDLNKLLTENAYKKAIDSLSIFFEVAEDELRFIIEVLSGNPYRIFGCEIEANMLNLEFKELEKLRFNESKLIAISEAIGCNLNQIKKVWCLWIQYNNFIVRGEKEIANVTHKILGIDQKFFTILWKEDCKNDIRKFLKKHLENMRNEVQSNKINAMKQVKVELVHEFQEKLNSAVEDNEISAATKELFKLPQSLDKRNNNAVEFLELCLKIINIIEASNSEVFKEMLKKQEFCGELLFHIYNVFTGQIDAILSALVWIWEEISTNPQSKLASKSESVTPSLILQSTIFFVGAQITDVLSLYSQRGDIDRKRIEKFISYLQSQVEDDKILEGLYEDFTLLIPLLFKARFFDELAGKIFEQFSKESDSKFDYQSVLGIMLGLSNSNNELVLSSIIDLKGETKKCNIKGLFALITKDPRRESDLRSIFKSLRVPHKISMNLLRLVSSDNYPNKYLASLNIWKEFWNEPTLVSALVGVFNKDLSNIRIICDTLKLDIKAMKLAISLVSKDYNSIKDKIPFLAKKLTFENEEALRIILSSACGQFSPKLFDSEEIEFAEAVLGIMEAGKNNTSKNMKSLLNHCRALYHSLSYLISDESEIEEDIKVMKNNFFREIATKHLKSQIRSPIMNNFEGGSNEESISEKSDDSEYFTDEEASKKFQQKQHNLYESIVTIVFACMGDISRVQEIAQKLKKYYGNLSFLHF
jgi:hypothetical protein